MNTLNQSQTKEYRLFGVKVFETKQQIQEVYRDNLIPIVQIPVPVSKEYAELEGLEIKE